MKIVLLNHPPRGANLFHLVHTMYRHPDMKRQRSRRLRSRAMATARILKSAPVNWGPQLPETRVALRWYQQDALGLLMSKSVISAPTGLGKCMWRRYDEY